MWAWGVSGMAIEWHGYFDYSTFHDPIGNFDFCTADTACTASDYDCNLNTTDAGGTGASAKVRPLATAKQIAIAITVTDARMTFSLSPAPWNMPTRTVPAWDRPSGTMKAIEAS